MSTRYTFIMRARRRFSPTFMIEATSSDDARAKAECMYPQEGAFEILSAVPLEFGFSEPITQQVALLNEHLAIETEGAVRCAAATEDAGITVVEYRFSRAVNLQDGETLTITAGDTHASVRDRNGVLIAKVPMETREL